MRLLMTLAVWLALVGVAGAPGRTTICDVQEYDEMGFSPLVGQSVTVSGVVTVPPGYFQPLMTSFYIEANGCGVNVFDFVPSPGIVALGDSVEVSGEVVEYMSSGTGAGATTQVYLGGSEVLVLSSGNPAPVPTQLTCAEVNMEENEGRLLVTSGVVTELELPYLFYITDGTDEVEVYRGVPDSVSFAGIQSGDTLCVTGVLGQYDRTPPFLDRYELMPRTNRDIRDCSGSSVREASWGSVKALFR